MAFDQKKYTQDWDRKNMKLVGARYRSDFVDEFKEACSRLNITQSSVIREAMKKTIEEAEKLNKVK